MVGLSVSKFYQNLTKHLTTDYADFADDALRNEGIEENEWNERNWIMEGDSARGIITFDMFGTDKLVCRADPIERVTMVWEHHLLHNPIPFVSFFENIICFNLFELF